MGTRMVMGKMWVMMARFSAKMAAMAVVCMVGLVAAPGVAAAHSVGVDVGAGAPGGSVGVSARYQPMGKGFLELTGGRGLTGPQIGLGVGALVNTRRALGNAKLYAMGAFSLGFQDKKAVDAWVPRTLRAAGTYHWVNLGAGIEWRRQGRLTVRSEADLLMAMAVIEKNPNASVAPRHVGAYARALRVGVSF